MIEVSYQKTQKAQPDSMVVFKCLNEKDKCKKILLEAKISPPSVLKLKCKSCKCWSNYILQ